MLIHKQAVGGRVIQMEQWAQCLHNFRSVQYEWRLARTPRYKKKSLFSISYLGEWICRQWKSKYAFFTVTFHHREKKTKKIFFRYYLNSAGCLYRSFVFSIAATRFNLQLRNFGIKFLVWLSKTLFSNFWKIVFFQSYCTFSIFL